MYFWGECVSPGIWNFQVYICVPCSREIIRFFFSFSLFLCHRGVHENTSGLFLYLSFSDNTTQCPMCVLHAHACIKRREPWISREIIRKGVEAFFFHPRENKCRASVAARFFFSLGFIYVYTCTIDMSYMYTFILLIFIIFFFLWKTQLKFFFGPKFLRDKFLEFSFFIRGIFKAPWLDKLSKIIKKTFKQWKLLN